VQQLSVGARSLLGLCLTAEHLAAFQTYYDELDSWNQRFNLTTIVGHREVQIKHFLDSLTCLLAFASPANGEASPLPDAVPLFAGPGAHRCIDVGTGAGFPGIPLKIIRPNLRLTLLEATGKKVTFLRHVVEKLGLEQVQVIHGRAEELAHDPEHRERYAMVLARAVAKLPTLAEYCLPFCEIGGRFVAQKGPEVEEEAESAVSAFAELGGRLREVKVIHIPELDQRRTLVAVDKERATPKRYPRRPGVPSKRPLR
jgi:16S rRNA (guanine527-N7)-methyltransferase